MSKLSFLAEADIMKKMKHDNLVRLYGICSKREPIYIITELMSHGSLLSYLRDTDGPGADLKFGDQVYMAAQVR